MKISPITDRPKAEKIAADAEFLIVQKKENGEKGTFLADAKKLADHISTDAMKEQADRAENAVKSVTVKAAEDEGGKSIPRTAVFEGNKVYTKGGVSLGQNTSAGGKCFILRSGKKETKGCSLVVGFMTDDEFNTLSGLVAGGLYISARLDYNFDGYKVTKIEKVTDGKVADGDVRFTLDSEFRTVEGKNWYAESNFPDRLTADKAACVSVGTNTPENTVKTATLWVIGHPEVGTFGIDELVDTDGNIVSADARGYKTSAVNIGTFAAGRNSNASGKYSAVFGDENNAGYASFAAGKRNTAYPECTAAFGHNTHAKAVNTFSSGFQTEAGGENGFTNGFRTRTTKPNEAAFGKDNKSDADTLFSIGSGTDSVNRKNAFEVKQNGDAHIEGKGYAGGKELADKETVESVRKSAENRDELINSEMKRHSNRLSNLESAVTGKITETATFADKVTYRGMTVPENILPYARLNRIGGITKAVATKGTSPGGSAAGEDFTVTTWNDVPSDIKYIRSRGFNQGGCIPYTDGEFSIPLTFVQDGKSYDLANHCTFSDDGTITVAFHDYEVSSYIGSCSGDFKIKGSISQSKVPSFITARVNKFPVVLDGTRYKIQSSADEMRCVPLEIVKPSGTTITVTAEGYRIYGSKGFVGDIAPNSFNATTEWTKTDPNDNPNRKVTDYYFEVSCKNFASYDWSDFKLKLRLGVFNTSETMTVEMYRKYTPPTLVERPTLPSGKYMHGFSKKFSNFLTFSDDGKVTYTDNYRKYVCDIAHYEEHAESISYIMDNAFIDSVVEVPITNPWFASLPSVSGIDYYQARPDYEFVCSTLTPSEMTALLAKNVGAFVSRTLDPDEITVTEIAEDFDPIIPLYEKGAVQFIDSDGEPTDGILDITYQTKVTEA